MDFSRSVIASAYGGWTAPISTSSAPACRTTSHLSVAWQPRRTASARRMSEAVRPMSSAIDHAAVLHRVDDLRNGRVTEEHPERDDRLPRRDSPRAIGETLVHNDDIGVLRDRVHRSVLDCDVLLLQLSAQGAGQHDAAAHSCVTGDDQLAYVTTLDARHGQASSGSVRFATGSAGAAAVPLPCALVAATDSSALVSSTSVRPASPSLL